MTATMFMFLGRTVGRSLGWLALALYFTGMLFLPPWAFSANPPAGTATAQDSSAPSQPQPAAVDPEQDDHGDDHGEDETDVGKIQKPVTREIVREELLLDISGIRDHAHLRFLKDKIRLALPENTVFYERRISRGRVVIALKTKMELAELRRLVGGLGTPEMGGFAVLDSGGNQLQVRVP